jgi:hypothetical protein
MIAFFLNNLEMFFGGAGLPNRFLLMVYGDWELVN